MGCRRVETKQTQVTESHWVRFRGLDVAPRTIELLQAETENDVVILAF